MSDYTVVFDGAAKDAAGNVPVLGADHDTEYDAISTMSGTKANKIAGATAGNLLEQDASGDIVDSGIDSDNLDGLTGVVETRLASLEPTAAVTNHVRSGYMQVIDGSQVIAAFDWKTAIGSASSWETFGPTGSGATNIYDELDDIPSTANAIILASEMEMTLSGASQGDANLYAALNGITGTINSGTSKQTLNWESDSGDTVGTVTQFIVPCDGSQIFQMAWAVTNSTIGTGNLYYRGFIEDLS